MEDKDKRTIRISESVWEMIAKRTEKKGQNASQFIRDCIVEELQPRMRKAECCGTCTHWLQYKSIPEFMEHCMSGKCKLNDKACKVHDICKKDYKFNGE